MTIASGPVPIPPPPPPPPPSYGVVRSRRDPKLTNSVSKEEQRSLRTPLTITIDGDEVPEQLASAFSNPQKNKKPFTYFSGGLAPDLSDKPSPRTVRKTNPPVHVPGQPKVLPIVPTQDLQFQETRFRANLVRSNPNPAIQSNPNLAIRSNPNPANMTSTSSTLMHAQYNSPMSLYSKDNVQEELNRATGQPNRPSSANFNVEQQSGAYRLLHEGGRVPDAHSARLDEHPKNEEYPHYRGFVDPNIQSPSFKRLQHYAGVDDEQDAARSAPSGGAIPLGYSSTQSAQNQNGPAQPQVVHSQTFTPVPKWSAEGPPVAQLDPASDDRDHSLDPNFAAKIAAAERPNVPPSVSPSWARKAEAKHDKWQGYTSQQQQYQQQHAPPVRQEYQAQRQDFQSQQQRQQFSSPPRAPVQDYQPPRPTYQSVQTNPGWSQPGSQDYQDKWQRHYDKYNFETGTTAHDHRDRVVSRPRSTDPDSWRSRRPEREPWMKPYVAPNVLEAKFSPTRGGTSPRRQDRPFQETGVPSWVTESHNQPSFGGQYFAPGSGGAPGSQTGSYSKKTTSSTYRSHRTESSRSPAPVDYNYNQRKDVNISSLVSGEAERPGPQPQVVPDWSYKAEEKKNLWETHGSAIDPFAQRRPPLPDRPPSWAQKAEDTTKLWRNESEAWRQRAQMEQDVHRRATSAGPGSVGQSSFRDTQQHNQQTYSSGPHWRQKPVPHQDTVSTYTTTAAPVVPKWQDNAPASTKSQSQGSYVDPQGNQVNYTKEVYTSSEPGKEFSMLTQEEKKSLEEPLEPGVVSRHTTSKYYKKSTYTSQTSTSTNQAPPTVSFPQMHQQRIEAPRPGSYGPGDTQF